MLWARAVPSSHTNYVITRSNCRMVTLEGFVVMGYRTRNLYTSLPIYNSSYHYVTHLGFTKKWNQNKKFVGLVIYWAISRLCLESIIFLCCQKELKRSKFINWPTTMLIVWSLLETWSRLPNLGTKNQTWGEVFQESKRRS